MKRLDIDIRSMHTLKYCFIGDDIECRGTIEIDSFMDCKSDAVKAVYDRLEERNIKIVGKCEVYCNGKLWEVVDNG